MKIFRISVIMHIGTKIKLILYKFYIIFFSPSFVVYTNIYILFTFLSLISFDGGFWQPCAISSRDTEGIILHQNQSRTFYRNGTDLAKYSPMMFVDRSKYRHFIKLVNPSMVALGSWSLTVRRCNGLLLVSGIIEIYRTWIEPDDK